MNETGGFSNAMATTKTTQWYPPSKQNDETVAYIFY